MRITSIEPNEDSNRLIVGENKTKLQGVILTCRTWFGTTFKKKAFPTNYGLVGKGGNIIYYYFTDELGKELEPEESLQINNYLRIQEILGKV